MREHGISLGMLLLAPGVQADDARYQALPLPGASGGQGGGRALILDTREGHVWVWSENEPIATADCPVTRALRAAAEG